mmetsp:Transcript_11334/g.25772  ORF Transcript_11334/g.25772 Transcript_11334/m.25772 type:complete len:107 (+) Transcript_11334:346-666(+)
MVLARLITRTWPPKAQGRQTVQYQLTLRPSGSPARRDPDLWKPGLCLMIRVRVVCQENSSSCSSSISTVSSCLPIKLDRVDENFERMAGPWMRIPNFLATEANPPW